MLWKKKINLYLLLISLSVFGVYLYTFPRENGLVDSGLIAAAAVGLGIHLPTGFPSYLIIANLFSRIPLIDKTTSLYLLSIVSSCLTLVIVYRLIINLTKSGSKTFINLTAFIATISLAFSYQFWSTAINIETFPLTNLFIVLQLFMLTKIRGDIIKNNYRINKKTKQLILTFSTVFGFSLGLSPIIVFILAPILTFVFIFRKTIINNFKLFISSLLISFVVFVIVYSYLPIRAFSNPYLNFGDPTNLRSILNVITGRGFINQTSASNSNEVIGLTLNIQVLRESAAHYLTMLLNQFNPLILIFFVFGLRSLMKYKPIFVMLLSVFIFSSTAGIFYISGNQENWWLTGYIIIAIVAGLGLSKFFNNKKISNKIKKFPSFATAALILISFAPLLFWFPKLNRSQNMITSEYIKGLYYDVDKNAVIIGGGNIFEGQTAYAKIVKKYRDDIFPLIGNFYYDFSWYRNNIFNSQNIITSYKQKALISSTPKDNQEPIIYQLLIDNPGKEFYIDKSYVDAYLPSVLTNCINICTLGKYNLIPNGMLYKITASTNVAAFNQLNLIKSIRSLKNTSDYFYLELLANNQLTQISNLIQAQIYQGNQSGNTMYFQLPASWIVVKNNGTYIIKNNKSNFVIEITPYLSKMDYNPQVFILQDNTAYGKLINKGLALIPQTKYAYVKIWNDNGIRKDEFYLFYNTNILKIIVWPSDSGNMSYFDSIISSLKFR